MTIPVPQSIDDYVKLLNDGTHFTQMNYGDGEWGLITGTLKGPNCDNKPATPLTSELLAKTILQPRFTFFGYNPGRAGTTNRWAAEDWLRERGINVPQLDHHALLDPDYGWAPKLNIRWAHKEIVPSANVRGRFAPVIRALRTRPLVIVGPDHLTHEFVYGTLKARKGGLVPLEWSLDTHLTQILDWTRRALDGMPQDTVLSLSLGYMAKVIAWYVADSHPHVTIFDAGAVWDPYCGQLSRSGYNRPEWPEMMAKNLAGAVEGRLPTEESGAVATEGRLEGGQGAVA